MVKDESDYLMLNLGYSFVTFASKIRRILHPLHTSLYRSAAVSSAKNPSINFNTTLEPCLPVYVKSKGYYQKYQKAVGKDREGSLLDVIPQQFYLESPENLLGKCLVVLDFINDELVVNKARIKIIPFGGYIIWYSNFYLLIFGCTKNKLEPA